MTQASTIHELTHGLPASSTLGMFNGVFWGIYQVNAAVVSADVQTMLDDEGEDPSHVLGCACTCAVCDTSGGMRWHRTS